MENILSVLTPATSTRLATVADVKAELGDNVISDDAANALIDRASSVITTYLGRALGQETVSETFRHAHYHSGWYYNSYVGGGMRQRDIHPLVLSRSPVTAITSVTENGVVLTETIDYEVDRASSALWRLVNGFRRAWGTDVAVVYTGGYVLPGDAQPATTSATPYRTVTEFLGTDGNPYGINPPDYVQPISVDFELDHDPDTVEVYALDGGNGAWALLPRVSEVPTYPDGTSVLPFGWDSDGGSTITIGVMPNTNGWALNYYGYRIVRYGSATNTTPVNPGPVTLPAVITDVCLQLVASRYHSQAVDTNIVREKTAGAGMIMYGTGRATAGSLTQEMKLALAPYYYRPVLA